MTENFRTLSVEDKIGQLFVVGLPGPELDAPTRELLDEVRPGGVCLFARNIREASQARNLTDGLRTVLGTEPVIAIDQEGGLVDRLRRVLTPIPAADSVRNAEEARWLANVIAEALLAIGVNMDFAPVVDVMDANRKGRSNGLTSRTFGSNHGEAAELAGAFLIALQSKGVFGCLKHFPGLGASAVDSHEELPVVDITQDELRSVDLFPYRYLIDQGGVNAIMVGHAAYPSIALQEYDERGRLLPSSMSFNFITNLLRKELGFDGLVITDDLEMGAIVRNYGIGDACIMAIGAGVDMLAICADPIAIRIGYRAVLDAVQDGRLRLSRLDESISRIVKLKKRLAAPAPFDERYLAQLSDEINTFTGQAALT